MRERTVLTALWLAAFVAALLLVESYVNRRNADGIAILLSDDRLDALKPLSGLYGVYLAGILGFWFAKPFKEIADDRARRVRFRIALACTLIFNAMILYMVGREHLAPGGNVLADIRSAVKIAAWMSLVVAPVNLYYFGMKAPTSE
jgi:hypothetical protein